MPMINVSVGEVVDKMTILEIKAERSIDEEKLFFINKELEYLNEIVMSLGIKDEHINNLRLINRELWDVEDNIRICESNKKFDQEFVQLARRVYILNDSRYAGKSQIDSDKDSGFREQKILPVYSDGE